MRAEARIFTRAGPPNDANFFLWSDRERYFLQHQRKVVTISHAGLAEPDEKRNND